MKNIENFSIEEMKKIAHEVIEEELKTTSLKISVFPLTFIEYYKKEIFTKPFSLIRVKNAFISLHTFGMFEKNNIYVFINRIQKIKKPGKRLFKLLETCYHEARHEMQRRFKEGSYEAFFDDIESFIMKCTYNDYNKNHDCYSFEIGANLYGITKAKEYMQSNYPEIYEGEKDEITEIEEDYRFDYMMYDGPAIIDKFIKIYHKNAKKYNINPNRISKTLDSFLNEDATFKPIKQIIADEHFEKIDKKVLYSVLSSKSFLKNVNIKTLSSEELSILEESLKYTMGVYVNQTKIIEKEYQKKNIRILYYLQEQKNLIEKILFLKKNYNEILKMKKILNNDKKIKR